MYDKASFSVMCHTGAPLYSSIPTGEDLKKQKRRRKSKKLALKARILQLNRLFSFFNEGEYCEISNY